MKKFHVSERKTGNLLITVICYDKKIYKNMMKLFQKIRNVNVIEVKEND